MTGAAAAVILFAAIVSYSHIHALATAHGEDSTQSHLLPLSIDGVIAEASLVMLFAARHKLGSPWLARAMLWAGIVATLAANAVVALPQSWISPVANVVIGAVLSAWPAAAFIASVELVMLLVRDVRAVAGYTGDAPEAGEDDLGQDGDNDSGGGVPKPRPKRTAADPVTAMLRRHPDWDDDKIAAKCGVHKRTVARRRKAFDDAKVGEGAQLPGPARRAGLPPAAVRRLSLAGHEKEGLHAIARDAREGCQTDCLTAVRKHVQTGQGKAGRQCSQPSP